MPGIWSDVENYGVFIVKQSFTATERSRTITVLEINFWQNVSLWLLISLSKVAHQWSVVVKLLAPLLDICWDLLKINCWKNVSFWLLILLSVIVQQRNIIVKILFTLSGICLDVGNYFCQYALWLVIMITNITQQSNETYPCILVKLQLFRVKFNS